jgi:protein-S-isoprenylcysteine O-methyltransferase Ste14
MDFVAASPWPWFGVAWGAWVISWLIAAVWSQRTAARAGFAEGPSRVVQISGVVLLFAPHVTFGPEWMPSETLGWIMLALVVAGFAFCWWARLHLGSLWSGSVQRKEGHRIVDTGPYALVRHPIYTGLLLSALATAIVRGHLSGLIGFALFVIGIIMKARLEERFLSADLGAEYAAYKARVPMLVPFTKFG